MKKALLAALVIVLIVLGTLLVAPAFVDWNSYRQDVAVAIARATGRQVTIAGDLNLSVLPLPRLTVKRIGVASIDGAIEPEMLRIGELHMELALAPLMAGRIAVRSLSLIDPVLTLETTADGRDNWNFVPVERDTLPGRLAAGLSVDSVSVSNGRLVWRAAGAVPRRLDAVDATVSLGRPAGASRIQATAVFKGVPYRLTASVGRFERDRMAAVSGAIDFGGGIGTLAATGRLSADLRSASGTVQLAATDAERLGLLLAGGEAPMLPAWKVAADSTFTFGRDTVSLHDIAVTYGDIRGTGEARLVLDGIPALDAHLVVGTMQIDDVVTELQGRSPRGDQGGTEQTRWSWAGPVSGFMADLDLSVRAARWRGGVIRNIGAAVKLGPEGTVIERMAMTLPGGTDVTLSAAFTGGASGPRWDGDLAVISDNLRGALIWAGMAADELPADRLRSFSLTSRIAATPDAVHLTSIAGRLDATRMNGAATIARRARPSFGVRLHLDQFELDAYLPRWMRTDVSDGAEGGGLIPTAGRFDANLAVSVGTLILGGRSASQAVLDARLFDGNVLLRKLSIADLGGGALTVSGTVDDVDEQPRGDLEVSLDVDDAERFARFMKVRPGTYASRVGGFRLGARATGTISKAAVAGTLDIAGGRIQAEGTVRRRAGTTGFEFAVAADHADADKVLDLFAPDRPPGRSGAIAMTFALSGTADTLKIRDLDATLGDMKIAGRIDVDYRGDRPAAIVALTAGRLDLVRLLPALPDFADDTALASRRGSARWSREAFDLSALRGLDLDLTLHSGTVQRDALRLDGFELRTDLSNGVLTIERLTGRLFEGEIEASGRIDTSVSPPEIMVAIAGRDIAARPAFAALAALDRLDGPISFSLALSAKGQDPYDLVTSVGGTATLSGNLRARRRGDESIPAGAVGDAADMLLKAFAGSTAELSGRLRIESGTVRTGDLLLDAGSMRTMTVGAVDLSGWRIESTTTLRRGRDDANPPDLIAIFRGSLDDPIVELSGPAVDEDDDDAPPPEAAPVLPVEPVAPTPIDLDAGP